MDRLSQNIPLVTHGMMSLVNLGSNQACCNGAQSTWPEGQYDLGHRTKAVLFLWLVANARASVAEKLDHMQCPTLRHCIEDTVAEEGACRIPPLSSSL